MQPEGQVDVFLLSWSCRWLCSHVAGSSAPALGVLPCSDAQMDAGDLARAASTRRRRSKKSPYDVKNLLLVLATMSCVFTMLYLFIRVSTSPAVASMQQAGPLGHGLEDAVSAAGAEGVTAVQSAAKSAAQQAAKAVSAGAVGGGGGAEGAPVGAGGVP